MGTKFSDVMREIEAEAQDEGPSAVEELRALRDHFRIGRQLAEARLAQNMTQAQVASRAQIDQADVSRIERGIGNPTIDKVAAHGAAVGLELSMMPRKG